MHPSIEHLMQYFDYSHLPEPLRTISSKFADLAEELVHDHQLEGPEASVGLRKLLEAKDCFVRAAVKP